MSIDIRDHPCVCGEKCVFKPFAIDPSGSPLRMRGKAQRELDVLSFARITPAYAGKRCVNGNVCWQHGDHPCVCGEKRPAMPYALRLTGSPLRMRGKGICQIVLKEVNRITPAYAGKRAKEFLKNLLKQDHPCVCGEKR